MGKASRLAFDAGFLGNFGRMAVAAAAVCAGLSAQDLMSVSGGVGRPLFSDAAVLEAQETRKDVACTVDPIKPELGFDLKFHAGYEVTVPLNDLEGNGNHLTMVFRVVPAGRADAPVYMSQHIAVPEIDAGAKGDAYLEGAFVVGEGKYHVSWLMRDRSERICSSNWDIDASLSARDKPIPLEIAAAQVQPDANELFKREPPPEHGRRDASLHVKVLVNFAPQSSTSAAMQPVDEVGLVAILRNIAREPRFGRFSLVAFNMQEQRVVYRQENSDRIDFPALGAALRSLTYGTVQLKQLVEKHGDADFLGGLMTAEMCGARDKPDAVIFAGPKVTVEDAVPPDSLKQLAAVDFPIFYLNYLANPAAVPWRDAIGGAVHYLKGSAFTISRPRDLFVAWGEIMRRIVESKEKKTAGGSLSSR
ncbi:MAG: acetyltransferase [Bryobacteraceae bacterium]|jgi:hypothetical protein